MNSQQHFITGTIIGRPTPNPNPTPDPILNRRLPAGVAPDEPELWHMQHDSSSLIEGGDGEDLDLAEVKAALKLYTVRQANKRKQEDGEGLATPVQKKRWHGGHPEVILCGIRSSSGCCLLVDRHKGLCEFSSPSLASTTRAHEESRS